MVLLLLFTSFILRIPKTLRHLLVTEFVVDSVRTYHYEVMLLTVYLKVGYLWFGDQDLGVSFVFGKFCFDVSERTGNREFSRFYPERSDNDITIFIFD